MSVTLMSPDPPMTFTQFEPEPEPCTLEEFRKGEESEALDYLSRRPVETAFMAGLIHDNGLVSPHNRGSFYACRNPAGQLEGISLIGHATVVETQNDSALIEFAKIARHCQSHLIRGEREIIERFWEYYSRIGQQPRLVCRELLMNLNEAITPQIPIADLKPAQPADLDKIMSVNAAMAVQEGGVSPLQRDPSGFRQRTLRRIEQGRVLVWIEDNRLIFKADLVAETPQAIYLEGVHVHEEERRKGYGLQCLTQLTAKLLERAESICLTVNENNKAARKFYEKVGYQFHGDYQTIYLR
jgi:uncharacterized protein